MNQAPALAALQQLDGPTALDAGVGVYNLPRLAATLDDPENDQVHLDVEIVISTASFTNAPTLSTALSAEGTLEVALSSLPTGTYKWQARARDAAGATSAWVPFAAGADAFTLLPNPVTATVSIAAGATALNTNTVTLTLSASSGAGAITTMAFSNDGTTFSSAEPYATSRAGWVLAPSDGTRAVFVRFTDALGNTAVVSDSIVIDTVPPQLTGFVINADAAATGPATVTLTYAASDPGSGIATTQAANDGATFATITASPAAWVLSTGDGAKTVTVRVTDQAGNATTATDGILRDATAPVLMTAVLNAGATFTSSASVQLTATAGDGSGSGLAQLCVQGAVVTPGCVPFGAGGPYPVTLSSGDGAKAVNVTVVDAVGNVSNIVTDSITLDTTVPTFTSITLAGGAAFTRTATVTALLASPFDTNLTQMEFSTNGGTTWNAPVAYAASSSVALPTPDGLKTVHVRLIDAAGNRSVARFDDITLDTTAPTLAITAPRGSNQTSAQVALTPAMDASGVVSMCLKVTAIATAVVPPTGPADACFVTFAATASVTVSTGGAGDKRVHAWVVDGAGNVSPAATTDVFYDVTAPTAPSGLTATPSNHGLILSWTAATDVGGSGIGTYEAGLSKTSGGPYVFQAVGNGTSGFVEASNDVTWFVVLRARDVAGNVSATVSNQVSGTPYFPWEYQQRRPTSVDLADLEVFDAGTATRWVAVGESGFVLSSDDSLASFTRRDALTDNRLVGLSKAAGALYAVGDLGVLSRSDDFGVSFVSEAVPAQLASATIADVGVVGSGTGTVTLAAVSYTGDIARQVITGGTRGAWTHVGRPTTNALRSVARCSGATAGTACAGANSGVSLAVGNTGTILRSNDSGLTWSVVPLGTLAVDYASRNFSSVVHRPSTNEFFISVNNVGTTLAGLLIYDAQSNLLTSAGASWLGPVAQVRLTEDGTTGIALVPGTFPKVYRFGLAAVGAPTMVSGLGSYAALAAVTTAQVGTVGPQGQVGLASTTTIAALAAGFTTSINAITFQAGASANAWLVGASGLLATTVDTGATWVQVASGTTASLRSVAMVSTSAGTPYVVAVGTASTILRKRGANAWGLQSTTIGTNINLLDVSCTAPATTSNTVRCVAVGTNGVVATLMQDVSMGDGTWVIEPTMSNNSVEHRAATYIHVSGTNYRIIVAGVGGRVVRWTGAAWTDIETIAGGPTINDLATRHGTVSQTMACGNAGAIRYTTDYGATWTSHNPMGFSAETFTGCANLPGTNDWLVVGSSGTMLKGTWTGSAFTWQTLPRQSSQLLSGIATGAGSPNRAYVAGGGGTVLTTATGGE